MKSYGRLVFALGAFIGVSGVALADPMTPQQLFDALKLGSATKKAKPAIELTDPGTGSDQETGNPEPRVDKTLDFTLRAAGGALIILDTLPKDTTIAQLNQDLVAAQTKVQASMISDILVFPPKQGNQNVDFLNLFSEPFPANNTFTIHDPSGNIADFTLTLAQLQNPGGGRQVVYIQEGSLIDPRANPPLGASVDLRQSPFDITGLTVFITPRGGAGKDQAYFIFSDTEPIPEPGTLVLAGVGGLTMLLGRIIRLKLSSRQQPAPS